MLGTLALAGLSGASANEARLPGPSRVPCRRALSPPPSPPTGGRPRAAVLGRPGSAFGRNPQARPSRRPLAAALRAGAARARRGGCWVPARVDSQRTEPPAASAALGRRLQPSSQAHGLCQSRSAPKQCILADLQKKKKKKVWLRFTHRWLLCRLPSFFN